MYFFYNTELLGDVNQFGFFSVDESLFAHSHNKHVWILGIIDNTSKDFRLDGTFNRDTNSLKNFITKYVKTGNTIISDSWRAYNFIGQNDSGYIHIQHNHNQRAFGQGIISTSHIESIWSNIKSKIKSVYNVFPGKNIMKFLREAEYKYKLRDKNYDEKMNDLFECQKFLLNVEDVEIEPDIFDNI